MIENATSRELRSALEEHLQQHAYPRDAIAACLLFNRGWNQTQRTNEIFDKMASAVKDSSLNIGRRHVFEMRL